MEDSSGIQPGMGLLDLGHLANEAENQVPLDLSVLPLKRSMQTTGQSVSDKPIRKARIREVISPAVVLSQGFAAGSHGPARGRGGVEEKGSVAKTELLTSLKSSLREIFADPAQAPTEALAGVPHTIRRVTECEYFNDNAEKYEYFARVVKAMGSREAASFFSVKDVVQVCQRMMPCPYCDAQHETMRSQFNPTLRIYTCRQCHRTISPLNMMAIVCRVLVLVHKDAKDLARLPLPRFRISAQNNVLKEPKNVKRASVKLIAPVTPKTTAPLRLSIPPKQAAGAFGSKPVEGGSRKESEDDSRKEPKDGSGTKQAEDGSGKEAPNPAAGEPGQHMAAQEMPLPVVPQPDRIDYLERRIAQLERDQVQKARELDQWKKVVLEHVNRQLSKRSK